MIREGSRSLLLGVLAVAALAAQAPAPVRATETLVMPELTLSVNGFSRTTIPFGMPLVFELWLRNGAAARSAGAAAARKQLTGELEEQVLAGKLTRQDADSLLKKEPVPPLVPSFVITLAPAGFAFRGEGPRGPTTLPWQPRMVDPEAPAILTLDAKEIAAATFVVEPEKTASAAAGTYLLRAHFRNQAPGQWQGTVTSNPVEITLAAAPRAPSNGERKENYLITAEYFLAVKDFDRAITAVQKVFALAPQSIDGLVLLGRACERKGNFQAALEAFEKAHQEFGRRYPGLHQHPPVSLIRDILRMQAKLGIRVPGVAVPAPANQPTNPPAAAPPPAQSTPRPASSSPPRAPAGSAPGDRKVKAMVEYEETIRKGDALCKTGDYFEAVRVYEQAWRIAYNNKLPTEAAALEERLAKARKARDEKKH